MTAREPWLDGLSDDWEAQSRLSSLSRANGSPKQSRRPTFSLDPMSQNSVVEGRQGRSDQLGRRFSPSRADSRQTYLSIQSSNPSGRAGSTRSSQCRFRSSEAIQKGNKSALRASLTTTGPSTINIKPSNKGECGNTPEWKRRLLRGDVPTGENGDLFGPIGLQKLFTPPLSSESGIQPVQQRRDSRNKSSLRSRLSGNPQSYDGGSILNKGNSQKKLMGSWDKENINLTWMERMSEVSAAELSRLLIGISDHDIGQLKQEFSKLSLSSAGNSVGGTRGRSVSALEDTRNEAISPIPLPTSNKCHDENCLSVRRPTSSASDCYCELYAEPNEAYTEMDESIEMTSQSLPEGLSMGTHEFASAGGFVNMRRGGYSDDSSFHRRWLSPAITPSQLPPSISTSRIQHRSPKSNRQGSAKRTHSKYSHPFTPKKQSLNRHENNQQPDISAMRSSGSPLKLFGNYDTFTNNKLLRRMSQFEETFDAPLEEGPSCAIESDDDSEDDPHSVLYERQNRPGASRRTSAKSALHMDTVKEEESIFRSSRHSDKRVLNSPTKESAPKRRRTLLNAKRPSQTWHEPIIESAEFNSAQASPQPPENQVKTINPSQGSRATRRSEKSTPAQTRQETHQLSSPAKSIMSRSSGPSSRAMKHGPADNVRKGSITTQDFLNEATKIMNHIRTHGGPKKGLPGLEESVAEGEDNVVDTFSDASTQEEFSRPPSREGRGSQYQEITHEPDPRIVSHLKRFEDSDELDVFMGTSVMSLRLKSQQKCARRLDAYAETDMVSSSPTNIRIQEGIQRFHSRHQSAGQASDIHTDLGISREDLRTATSTESISNGSTGSAKAKGIISSQMISHLIPERVGVMTYDKTHHMWVKGRRHQDQLHASLISEDDPFRDIPDLSVDELRELMAIRNAPQDHKKTKQPEPTGAKGSEVGEDKPQLPNDEIDTRPQTLEGKKAPFDLGSVQSKSTRFTSSERQPETRATSWATEDITNPPVHLTAPQKPATAGHAQEAEHESRLHDGYPSPLPSPVSKDRKQARAVTVTFSSPQVSRIDSQSELLASQSHQLDESTKSRGSLESANLKTAYAGKRRLPTPGTPSARGSLLKNGRRISRIEEGEEDVFNELSPLDKDRSALAAPEEFSLMLPHDSRLDTSYSFHMSPLAEFTVNQFDESLKLELSHVAERTYPHSLRQVHGSFALAAEELIKHITDVEPYEAYWEHLRRLNLRSKKLVTLLRLSKYCGRLEELDASENSIGQVSGIPTTMRSLNLSSNCLSNLTAWSHLLNLQYLDISNNELENLDGLSGLVHLRSLKVNNNKLRCINGVFNLDGLLTLKARNNQLTYVDFKHADL